MKVKSKILSIVVMFVAVMILIGFRVEASYIENDITEGTYIIENADGKFRISIGEEKIEGEDLSLMLADLPDGISLFFSDVESSSQLEIKGRMEIYGSITQSSAAIILDGDIILNADINLLDCAMVVKSGKTTVDGGIIMAQGSSAFALDRSADAKLIVNGGRISSDHINGTIDHSVGIVYINGGEISSFVTSSIITSSSLYLSGTPSFSSVGADILTARSIHLSVDGDYFSGEASVRFEKEFPKGEFSAVLLDAQKSQLANISVEDKSGLARNISFYSSSKYTDEKNFFAVFDANEARFFIDGSLYHSVSFASGETISEPKAPDRCGYVFCGWYSDSSYKNKYAFGIPEESSLNLYASFSLMPPSFTINSLSFMYDGDDHYLAFSECYHPLADIGSYSYVWYKDGELIACSSDAVLIRDVSDSGEYYCKLSFSYNGDFITVTTPSVAVIVEKLVIDTPTASEYVYNGSEQKISLSDPSLYISDEVVAIAAGEYYLTLSLIDSDNFRWRDSEGDHLSVKVKIIKAENSFCSAPKVFDAYEGQALSYAASSLFGEVTAHFSCDGVAFDSAVPTKPGIYYVRFSVVGTENYSDLISDVLTFSILEEKCIGLRTEGALNKTCYYAFEKLIMDGIEIIADYNSGRSEYLDKSKIFVEYKTGECLLASDTCAMIHYGGVSIPISVSVSKVEYDISGVQFSDSEAVYNGERHTLSALCDVVGKDGIPLAYSIEGGGINAGEYTVRLVFFTESINYVTPQPITAKLSVLPMPIVAEYSDTEFVYDGKAKIPSATAIGASGVPFRLSLSGAGCYAGSYTAVVVLNDGNYTVINPTVTFIIKKAVIDLSGVIWSENKFIYNGEAHSVRVNNLPTAVSVIGYTDASFIDAGNYIAVAILSYDSENYEDPMPLTLSWSIAKASYDISSFDFIDKNTTYNGEVHYPELVGEMPIGVDGSILKFSFSAGAKRVSDGRVAVTVSFSTDSVNYTVPESRIAYVTVSPMNIDVSWGDTDFVYDGNSHIPIATTTFCNLIVHGEGVDAGDYTAVCESENSDYRVVNSSMPFTIKKAENEWIKLPGIDDIYESGTPSPYATAKNGEAEFVYYKDPELTSEVSLPLSEGTYYLKAYVEESKNYMPLYSDAIPFCVISVKPIGIEVELCASIVAYTVLDDSIMKVYFINNDGTRSPISYVDIEVDYGADGNLLAGQRHIVLKAGGIEQTIYLTVSKASFDMSGVYWSEVNLVYNGDMQSVYLVGLPEGLSVEYICSGGITAGEYDLCAKAIYDSENYNEPQLPTAKLVISKKIINVPTCEEFIYDGTVKTPTFVGNEFCMAKYPVIKNAGEYTVEYQLYDPENYSLSDLGITLITVAPMPIEITVIKKDEFEITSGALPDGEMLTGEFYTESGYIYFRAYSDNYDIKVVPLKQGMKAGAIWLLIILLLILAFLICGAWYYIKKRESGACAAVGGSMLLTDKKTATKSESKKEKKPELRTIMAVDETHANDLITDSLAKSLISEDKEIVYTHGYKKCIVNIDMLCSVYDSGDRIDINSMKKRGLISPEARYVKVLGGGVIDKPLTVLANSFSLSAAKMIALTGGKAIKVRTQRDRRAK